MQHCRCLRVVYFLELFISYPVLSLLPSPNFNQCLIHTVTSANFLLLVASLKCLQDWATKNVLLIPFIYDDR